MQCTCSHDEQEHRHIVQWDGPGPPWPAPPRECVRCGCQQFVLAFLEHQELPPTLLDEHMDDVKKLISERAARVRARAVPKLEDTIGIAGSVGYADHLMDSRLNVERIEGWVFCPICNTPFPNEGFKLAHQATHITRAIAAR